MMESHDSFLSNETLFSINNRRSVRNFLDKPVDDSLVRTILHAANQAPSAHNQQSWRFVVLSGEKKSQLVDLIGAKAGDFPKPSCALLRMASRSIASAPLVIAVANTGELISRGTDLFKINKEVSYDFFRIMEIQSSAAAVQNLLLAVTSLGLGAVWLGVLVLIKNDILHFLGEPDGEFMAVIPVGYPARSSSGPQKHSLDVVAKYLT
jgi:nitroreductase